MFITVFALLLFLSLTIAIFAFGSATVAPASGLGARLRALMPERHVAPVKPKMSERVEQVLDPFSKALPKSPTDVSKIRALLMQAGYREARHLTTYYGVRAAAVAAAFALLVVTGLGLRHPLWFVAFPAVAYLLPRMVLKRMVRARQNCIRLSLPDALDLAVICVEAGLGLDQSIQRVGQELKHAHPQLSEEFSLANLEMRAGKPRAEALRNLALRTGVDDLRALVAVLVQTDRFGTSVASALRVHSEALRTERRQRAEEMAAKTTIKMVPVLVFFVFPSMFIVSLGPAAIQLYRNLLPAIQK
jgi:tight adherence protein C